MDETTSMDEDGREHPSLHQDCSDGQVVHGAIAFMTRLISGALRIHPAVISNRRNKWTYVVANASF